MENEFKPTFLIIARNTMPLKIGGKNMGGVERFISDQVLYLTKNSDITVDVICPGGSELIDTNIKGSVNFLEFELGNDRSLDRTIYDILSRSNLEYEKYGSIINHINYPASRVKKICSLNRRTITYLHGTPKAYNDRNLNKFRDIHLELGSLFVTYESNQILFKNTTTLSVMPFPVIIPDEVPKWQFTKNDESIKLVAMERFSMEKNPWLFMKLFKEAMEGDGKSLKFEYYVANGKRVAIDNPRIKDPWYYPLFHDPLTTLDEINEVLSGDDVMVTCLSTQESLGYTAKEAMMRGIPVLAFGNDYNVAALDLYASGIERELEGGIAICKAGIVIEPNFDPKALIKLLADPETKYMFDRLWIRQYFLDKFTFKLNTNEESSTTN